MSSLSPLIKPVSVGGLKLQHRAVLSAMTRLRMDPVTEAPTDLTATYYEQRASPGGLLLTECAALDATGRGYVRAAGLFTDAHIEGWKKVTDAVHKKGGSIFLQGFHPGRVSHSSLIGGKTPIAPSAIQAGGQIHIVGGKADYEVPRALETDEIPGIIDQFVQGARRAVDAGFDGIELHAGNGYLIQQFMALKTNQRTDKYGGSVENRMRFLLELLDATAAEVGADKVGVKLQPGVVFTDLIEPADDVGDQLDFLGPELAKRKLAFVELSSLNGEPYYRFLGLSAPNLSFDPFVRFRNAGYDGTLIINGAFTPETGGKYIADGVADLVSFGNLFISNANLPELIAAGVTDLNLGGQNPAVWYGGKVEDDEKGYTDWPLVNPVSA